MNRVIRASRATLGASWASLRTLGLLVLVAVAPAQALAQPEEPADEREEPDAASSARELFERAASALQGGRFQEASSLFERSLEAQPRPSTAFNLGVARRGLGDALGAVQVFEDLLDGAYGALEGPQRREARHLLREARADVGSIEVRIDGAPHASLVIDGEPRGRVEKGQPRTFRVNPGPRRLEAKAPGREPSTRTFRVEAGGRRTATLTLPPDRRPGVLILESNADDAVLEIEGVDKAPGRLRRELPPGEYTVHARGDDGSRTTRVEVPPARRVRLVLDPPTRGFFEKPAFWVVAGVVVAGAAAGVTVGLIRRKQDPVVDEFWGNTEALSW
jgi:hypothetical protein